MLIRVLTYSFLLAALVIGGLGVYRDDGDLAIWLLPPLLAAAILYVFRPQLEWALLQRKPVDLDHDLVRMLDTRLPSWYAELSSAQRLTLRQRIALLVTGFEYKVQSAEERELPGDLAVLIVSQAARLSLASDILIPLPFETIVVYRHPFPSPQYPRAMHNSEIFAEDGVLMFNLQIAIPGVNEARTYFNVVLYEFARVYEQVNGNKDTIHAAVPPWAEMVAAVVGAEPNWVAGAVGLKEIDDLGVAIVLALDFAEAFAKTYPELDRELRRRYRPMGMLAA